MEIDLFIQKKLTLIENLLSFQKKVHLNNISLEENFVDKVTYMTAFQKSTLNGLFPNNLMVNESYHKIFSKLIIESKIDFSIEIEKFNYFIISEIKNGLSLINEQSYAPPPANSPQTLKSANASFEKNQVSVAVNDVKQTLTKAVDHIKKNGVTVIMEGLRKALFSNKGGAVQIALSFIQPLGPVINETAWAIMTLYDAYMYFKGGSTFNLVIDLFCLLSSGQLGKSLNKWVGKTASSVGEAVNKIITDTPMISKWISSFSKLGGTLMGWLKQAGTFMYEKMGIKWVQDSIGRIKTFFDKLLISAKTKMVPIVAKIETKIGPTVAKIENKILNSKIAAANFSRKVSGSQLMKNIRGSSMYETLVSSGKKGIDILKKGNYKKSTLKLIDEFIQEQKETTAEAILKWMDKEYKQVPKYSELYAPEFKIALDLIELKDLPSTLKGIKI